MLFYQNLLVTKSRFLLICPNSIQIIGFNTKTGSMRPHKILRAHTSVSKYWGLLKKKNHGPCATHEYISSYTLYMLAYIIFLFNLRLLYVLFLYYYYSQVLNKCKYYISYIFLYLAHELNEPARTHKQAELSWSFGSLK
jgi:hypothetical protein